MSGNWTQSNMLHRYISTTCYENGRAGIDVRAIEEHINNHYSWGLPSETLETLILEYCDANGAVRL